MPLVARLEVPGERVVCSDLGRARRTAELLGLQPAAYDPAWREIDVGEWGGRSAAEVDAEGDTLTNWRGGPRTAPSGETWAAFAARVSGAADALIAAGGSWLVVTHGGCIRAACAHVTRRRRARLRLAAEREPDDDRTGRAPAAAVLRLDPRRRDGDRALLRRSSQP